MPNQNQFNAAQLPGRWRAELLSQLGPAAIINFIPQYQNASHEGRWRAMVLRGLMTVLAMPVVVPEAWAVHASSNPLLFRAKVLELLEVATGKTIPSATTNFIPASQHKLMFRAAVLRWLVVRGFTPNYTAADLAIASSPALWNPRILQLLYYNAYGSEPVDPDTLMDLAGNRLLNIAGNFYYPL